MTEDFDNLADQLNLDQEAFDRGVKAARLTINRTPFFDVMVDRRIVEVSPAIVAASAKMAVARIESRKRELPKWKRLWLWFRSI
jgi:hypothetical protein